MTPLVDKQCSSFHLWGLSGQRANQQEVRHTGDLRRKYLKWLQKLRRAPISSCGRHGPSVHLMATRCTDESRKCLFVIPQRDPNDGNKLRISLLSMYAFHGVQADNWISVGLQGIKWGQNLGLIQGSHSFVQTHSHGKQPKITNEQCRTDSFRSRKT